MKTVEIIEELQGLKDSKFASRNRIIKAIKEYAGEEYETLDDLWLLSSKDGDQLKGVLQGIIDYYVAQLPVTYKIGDRFSISCYFGEYILAQVGNSEVNFINLRDGNRLSEQIRVKDIHNITEKEIMLLTRGGKFKKIN